MGPNDHDRFELGSKGQFVSLSHSLHRRTDNGMFDDVLYPFAPNT
jgi:hypothetical protein